MNDDTFATEEERIRTQIREDKESGRVEDSIEGLWRLIKLRDEHDGPSVCHIEEYLKDLLDIYRKLHRLPAVEMVLGRLFGCFQRSVGPYHSKTIETLIQLASTMVEQGRAFEAQSLVRGYIEGSSKGSSISISSPEQLMSTLR